VEGKTENSKMAMVISWYFLKILMAVSKENTADKWNDICWTSYKYGTTSDSLLMENYGIATQEFAQVSVISNSVYTASF